MKHLLKLLLLLSVGITCFTASLDAADTNQGFIRWEKEIAAFERSDATNPPPKNAWLFVGSSTIRLWKTLAADITNAPVINRGFGGSEIADSTHFMDRIILPYAPAKIFFRAGGNDIANGKSPEQVFVDYQQFVAEIHARLPETEIIFISWSPSPARWKQVEKERQLNGLVAKFTKGKAYLRFIDTYDMVLGADGLPRPELFVADRLHFNADGYKLLAGRVREFIATDK